MTVAFPRASSPELKPYIRPLGSMMLAYGRAHEAVVDLALLEIANEVEARKYVAGTEELPKKMRRLLRCKLDGHRFEAMNRHLKRLSVVAKERHNLIHGEWWFDPFDGGRLVVRRLHRNTLTHELHVTPDQIDAWTATLEEIADELELIQEGASRELEASGDEVPTPPPTSPLRTLLRRLRLVRRRG
ncbi:hypothetical protein [Methylobacterium aquaticum]|uniref:Uncharacterized protein n=1 Tax=Methylobacterium aquaticum TaxID=270351 RepID=A0A0C6FXS6_9HYPH|nr:hypothetical protein [Methylobacterium aquaticum]BAQ48140.1 hypothetical protein Maq22A_c26360 [Methylobacterium aquaticum]